MREQRDDDSVSDIYTNNEPRGDDSVSDVYTTDGNNSLYLPVGAEDDDSFQARVREEERKIIAEYSLDMSQSQQSSQNDVPQVVTSPQGLSSNDLLWNGSSVGTNGSRSIFANSYDGIMKRLRYFTPKKAKTNQAEPGSSPQRTKETESPSANAGYEPSFDDGFAEFEREVSMPPRTIIVSTLNRGQRKGLISRIRKLRADRVIAVIAAILFVAVAVALGSWAVSRYSGRNSDSAEATVAAPPTGTAASPPTGTVASPPTGTVASPPTGTVASFPTTSPSAIEIPNDEASENTGATPDPQMEDDVTSSPTFLRTASPTSSPTGAPSSPPTLIPTSPPTLIPTDSPTDSPVQSPTQEPSLPAPSAFPTIRATTAAPTALPTLGTTIMNPSGGQLVEECGAVDSSDRLVFINYSVGSQSCLWLSNSKRAGTRRRICREGFEAYEFCRKTCNNCSPTDSPTSAPTVRDSEAEVVAGKYLRDIILEVSPRSATALDIPQSPQARALSWLESTDYSNTEDWQIRQRWALASFAFGTKRDRWTVNTDWLDDVGNECNWFGVECDSQNRVTEIILRQNNLEGRLFPELILLADSLRVLDVGRNRITGEFPPEYGNLRNLYWLAVDRNGMTGELPRRIGDMVNLSILQVEFNQFRGELPSQLGGLNLREFTFFSNAFVGSVPEEICWIGSLQKLEGDCREIECPCCTRCWFQCGGWTGIPC